VDTSWMGRARCRSHPPSLFFPDNGGGVEVARRVCSCCPVRDECLEYAIAERIEPGVWGGTSERTRRRIRILRAEHGDAGVA
jgi:WhiB family redox-sensing transcriptional regulator